MTLFIGLTATFFTFLGLASISYSSIFHCLWYFFIWCSFIWFFHKKELSDFAFAFIVNSAFITIYYLLQMHLDPSSYGLTSYLVPSYTDDSYFFALVADSIPSGLEIKRNYEGFSSMFTNLVYHVTPFSIHYPIDVIFFQSGVAALLATFSKRLAFQLNPNLKVANAVYYLVLFCPFLMMNGGVIFIRDTFTAGLFVYSLYCFSSGRPILALAAVTLNVLIRLGTGLIFIPAYLIIYFDKIYATIRKNTFLSLLFIFFLLIGFFSSYHWISNAIQVSTQSSEGGEVGLLGRELFASLTTSDRNKIFLLIHEQIFPFRIIFNAAYAFLYPFLSFEYFLESPYFDIRGLLMYILIPIESYWLNAWFFAGGLRILKGGEVRLKATLLAFFVMIILIGTYSMQMRHKTIIYPLYYLIIGLGLIESSRLQRWVGFFISGLLFVLQLIILYR